MNAKPCKNDIHLRCQLHDCFNDVDSEVFVTIENFPINPHNLGYKYPLEMHSSIKSILEEFLNYFALVEREVNSDESNR